MRTLGSTEARIARRRNAIASRWRPRRGEERSGEQAVRPAQPQSDESSRPDPPSLNNTRHARAFLLPVKADLMRTPGSTEPRIGGIAALAGILLPGSGKAAIAGCAEPGR